MGRVGATNIAEDDNNEPAVAPVPVQPENDDNYQPDVAPVPFQPDSNDANQPDDAPAPVLPDSDDNNQPNDLRAPVIVARQCQNGEFELSAHVHSCRQPPGRRARLVRATGGMHGPHTMRTGCQFEEETCTQPAVGLLDLCEQ